MTLKVVLVQPQIPPNTGNIARTCAATGTQLHLVGPLGFELSDRYLKRAGLDYWPYVDLHYHQDSESFIKYYQLSEEHSPLKCTNGRLLGFTVRGEHNYLQYNYIDGDWLVFGSETEGLSSEILHLCQSTIFIPIDKTVVRSLNLSVSAAVALFEARRQLNY